jgi:hypothetical protein
MPLLRAYLVFASRPPFLCFTQIGGTLSGASSGAESLKKNRLKNKGFQADLPGSILAC